MNDPGQPVTAHWGVADPAVFNGPEDEQRRLFVRAYLELYRRIELFTCLLIESPHRMALTARLEEIGKAATAAGDED